ncbi:hypothetical protein Asal01_03381 [Fodinibius salicampi]
MTLLKRNKDRKKDNLTTRAYAAGANVLNLFINERLTNKW